MGGHISRLGLYGMSAVGGFTILRGDRAVWPLAVLLAGLFVGWFLADPGRIRFRTGRWAVPIAGGVALCGAADAAFGARAVLPVLLHVLLLLQAVYLAGGKRPRATRILFAIAIVQMMTAGILRPDSLYAGMTLLFIGFLLLERIGDPRKPARARPAWGLPGPVACAAIFAGVVALGSAVFLLLPRPGTVVPERSRRIAERVGGSYFIGGDETGGLPFTGIGEEMNLNTIGLIQTDPRTVALCRFERDGETIRPAGRPLWRVRTFDLFTGDGWGASDDLPPESFPPPAFLRSPRIRQVIVPGAAHQDMLLAVQPMASGAPLGLPARLLRTGMLFRVPSGTPLRTYGIEGIDLDPETWLAEPHHAARSVVFHHPHLIEVPDRTADALRPLSDRWAAGALTDSGIVRRIAERVGRECRYMRGTDWDPGEDPVSAFLLEYRRGHCEYFASATAVLLRLQGIPARIAGGYAGGDWIPEEGRYRIRQLHAHAWVEVYFGEAGWIPVDPSPVEEVETVAAANERASRRSDWGSRLSRFWHFGLMGYDARARGRTLDGIADSFARIGPLLRRVAVAAGITIAAGAGLLLFRRRRSGSRRAGAARPRRSVRFPDPPGFYRDLLDLLRHRGLVRDRGETPLEFSGSVAARIPDVAGPVHELTTGYCAIRFGNRPLDSRREKGLLDRLREVREVLDRPDAKEVSRRGSGSR